VLIILTELLLITMAKIEQVSSDLLTDKAQSLIKKGQIPILEHYLTHTETLKQLTDMKLQHHSPFVNSNWTNYMPFLKTLQKLRR